ncbi:MAG: hypothetical protein R3B57_07355 [Phycisphaerales bacterium]
MPLPTVLMTDVIRSADQGQSHGGAYLIDLESGSWRQVLDWDSHDISWEGRGMGRGLRGIAYDGDDIYIAASDELFVFDPDFQLQRSHKCACLHHAHEVFLDGRRLLVTSTTYDAIVEFDLDQRLFTRGWHIRKETRPGPNGLPLSVRKFDPRIAKAVPGEDALHINSVWVENGAILLSGTVLPVMLAIEGTRLSTRAKLPPGTHNARPFGGGVICNATEQNCVLVADDQGRTRARLPIVTYPEDRVVSTGVPADYARQGFARGLVTTDDGLVIVGSSPGTVTAYDLDSRKLLKSVNVTMDVRNAPHGLALWPY